MLVSSQTPSGLPSAAPPDPASAPTSPTSPGARRDWRGVPESARQHLERLPARSRAEVRGVLREDLTSEYDARFLSAHLRSLPFPLTPAFRRAEAVWAVDEERHYRACRAVVEHCFDFDPAILTERRPDFGPLAHLFEDEFSILCLAAYDELATVRAYRANLPRYALLGPALVRWVRGVIADEAWHYARFLEVAVTEHRHRLAGSRAVVQRIRASERVPYAATFVLDHDDPVFTEEMFDGAAAVLCRQLERAARVPC